MDRLDVVVWRHRALDRHGERHGVAVLDQRRQVERHLALADRGTAHHFLDGGGHRLRRRARGGQRQHRDQGGAGEEGTTLESGTHDAHSTPSGSRDRPPRPRPARPSGWSCRRSSLATRCRPVGPIIGRHDRVWIETRAVDDAQAELARRPARAGAGEARRQGALEALLGDRAAVAQQAKPDAAVGDDRPATRRIARPRRSAAREWHRPPRRSCAVRPAPGPQGQRQPRGGRAGPLATSLQPKVSAVIVLNQLSA